MGKWKDRLLAREKALSEGHYPDLAMKREDPVGWEILYSRFANLVQNSRESAKLISASPVVREMGECLFALFTPEGDSICFSTGLFLHVASMGSAFKWMLKNDYEETVGIKEGDYFMNNDPYLGGAHASDQMTVTPIMYKGDLVGWAAGLNHVPETGAIEPGGVVPSAMTRFDEGIFMPCVKIAENDQLKRDLEIMVERGTRTAVYWLLDSRARLAGCRMIRDGVKQLIDEYGLDNYMKAVYEFIEDTRQACVRAVKARLFPGKYRAVHFYDVPFAEKPLRYPVDYLLRIPVETTITRDGKIEMDFEGASQAGKHPFNAALPTTYANIMNMLIQNVFYNIKYNQGIFFPWSARVPQSVINPPDIHYACCSWMSAPCASNAMTECISRAYYEMGYREEVAAAMSTAAAMRLAGFDIQGRPMSMSLFEAAAAGAPGSAVCDGQNCAGTFFNPEGDCNDVEVWEKMTPAIFLNRRIHPDSGGFGKYRGGNGLEELITIVHRDSAEAGMVCSTDRVYVHPGIMGGYPASANYRQYVTDTNLRELIDKQEPLPVNEGDDPANPAFVHALKGEYTLTDAHTIVRPFKKYDVIQMINVQSGGYGDPLERDPSLVKRDIENGWSTIRTAEKVYCVAIDSKSLEVDYERTKQLRHDMREKRKQRGIPAAAYIKKQKRKIIRGSIPPIPKASLNECFGLSPQFLTEFREFWGLSNDFKQIPEKK